MTPAVRPVRCSCSTTARSVYKPGEKVWLESRDAARRRDGAGFDLKRFHRQALDLGPMGLDLLREAGRSLVVCLPERSE
ncbi:DUF885 family protein, partial [[Kitasatospora] papulosa]|uniref:DUF885 family protein n=1 Tax=[Kitasatospora] papulosa TaxID=1464011 RepID=UPI0035D7A005